MEPGAKIVAGYQNVMPRFVLVSLTEEQLNALIAYMKELQ